MIKSSQDEGLFGYKIGHALDESAEALSKETRTRLAQARSQALGRQKLARQETAAATWRFAGMTGSASYRLARQARLLAAALALGAALAGGYHWHHYRQAMENAAIDSALLADDLPINAYLDHGFRAWLESASASSQP